MAASLVKAGETLFLGSGSTVREMAPRLTHIPDLTIITNSLPVVNQLAASSVDLIIIGGMLRQSEQSMVGHVAEAAMRQFRADHVFMGIAALDVQHGLTSDYLPEALTDRTILQIGRHTIILADHSKFGRVNSVFLAPVTDADLIISGEKAPGEMVQTIEELGVQVMIA